MKNYLPVEQFHRLTRLLLSATLFISIQFLFAADVKPIGALRGDNTVPGNQHPPAAFAPPTASNPSPITVECKTDVPAPDSSVVIDATSTCGIKTIRFVSDVSDGASCPETITRTYEITDSCNASIQVTQSIIIHDLTPPVASNPPPIQVECTTDVPAPDPAVVSDATDNCGVMSVDFISESSDDNICPETITRTYEVLDSCGNSITVMQDIIVEDTTPPVVSSLPDINVSCKLDVPSPDPNIVSATDNCGVASINYVNDVSDGNTCPETIVRTYEVLDTCGNSSAVTQNIIVNDVTPPTASDPPDVTESCFPPADPSVVVDAADNCGVESINFVSDVSDGNSCPKVLTRTYEVVDSCGNSITVSHQITINDTIAPTASNPSTLIVDCRANLPAPDPTVVTDAQDNCGVESITFTGSVSDGNTCPELITRTYEITDSCDNSITVTHDIVVHDLIAPTAADPPNDTVSCPGDIPAPDPAVVTSYNDNCGVESINFLSETTDGSSCPETVTHTYEILDSCGNSTTATHTIIVDDTIPPTASTPDTITVNCAVDAPAPDPQVVDDAADNCGVESVTFVEDQVNLGQQSVSRIYRVTDSCGNNTDVVQMIMLNDNEDPTANDPPDMSVACYGHIPPPDTAVITGASDNCGVSEIQFIGDSLTGHICPDTVIRTYRVIDSSGNFIDLEQEFYVNDTTPPTASNPAALQVECKTDVPAPDPSVVSATDNCGVAAINFVSDVSDGNKCPETVTRTYEVVDSCGNSVTVNQEIIIHDLTAPVATSPPDTLVQCYGDEPVPDPAVITTASDNCGIETINYLSESTDGNSCPETITRTYEVIDSCGNSTLVTRDVLIHDTIPPTASNPDTITIGCPGNEPAPDSTVVDDAADNCGVDYVAFVDDVLNSGYISRTYEVVDSCGNSTEVVQTIMIDDTIPPTANTLPDENLQCYGQIPAPDTALINATDNCGIDDIYFVSDVSAGLNCPDTVIRTYAVVDDAGNSTNVTQRFIIDDDTPPTASNPAPVEVSCYTDVPAPDPTVVTDAADNCGVESVNFVSDMSDGNKCPEIITRTYEIVDSCGNNTLVTQEISILDSIPPTASNPDSTVVSCATDIPPANPAVVSDAADNCGIFDINLISESSDDQYCPETITRTYEVFDSCGNSINVTHKIIVNDLTPPTASNPDTIFVSCALDVPLPDPTVVDDASDNCGVFDIVYVGDVTDGNSCPENITRTYQVIDSCGNTLDVNQIIQVNDTTAPTASDPPDIAVDCAPPPFDSTVVSDATDNCGVEAINFVSDVSDGNSCPEVITRTYEVVDSCGNSTTVSHQITINDTTAPTASNPLPVVVNCKAEVPSPDPLVVTDAADNCGVESVSFVNDVTDGNLCPETITRTYEITDSCDNSVQVSQSITVYDTVPPTATTPPPLSVNCYSEVPAPDSSIVQADDNCGVKNVNMILQTSAGLSCPDTITRTYEILDSCDNSIIVDHIIIVNDTIDPVASDPPTLTVSCSTDVPAPDPTVVSASDNCGVPAVTFLSDSTDGNTCPQTIFRDYEVSDSCGNSVVVTQQIIVNDTINPFFTGMPADTVIHAGTAGCQVPYTWTEPIAQDNCSLDTTFSSHNPGDIFSTGTTPVVYTAMDECANTVTDSFTVTVIDTVSPVVTCPGDTTIENDPGLCQATYTWPSITATDNCGVDTVMSSVPNGSAFMVGTTTVTVQAVDSSGNIDSCSFNVTVLDTEDPVIDCPADIQTCDTIVDYQVVTATDNCGIQNLDQISGLGPNADYPVGVTTNVYVAEDVNGNTDTCSFTVEVFETPDLVLVGKDESYQGADDGQVTSTVTGGTPPYTYQWNTGAVTPNIYNLSAGMYYLVLTDDNGCMATDTVMLDSTDALPDLEMPTAYSPNGDGANDFFVIKGIERYSDNELLVFNRWGGLVYDQKGYSNQWNGKSNNGEELPDGTYYVILKIYSDDITLTGYVYLKR